MTRCEEFYEKWKRDPNWCGKCETEVWRINRYIETLDAHPSLRDISAGALRPILEKKLDIDTREKLLEKVENEVKQGKQMRIADIVNLMTEFPIGKKEPQIEEIPKIETQIIKAQTWKETMTTPISKMDEAVYGKLQENGVYGQFQEVICIKHVRPDILIHAPNKTVAIFLDGAEVHEGREDRDLANRELLAKRGVDVISLRYEGYSDEARDSIVQQIIEKIKE